MTDDVDDIIDDEASLVGDDELGAEEELGAGAVLGEGDADEDDDFLEDDVVVEAAVDDDDDDDDETEQPSGLSLDASEDGDDEMDDDPVVDLAILDQLGAEDDVAHEEEIGDAVREGEFVCSSCHMAKRSTALADADEQLCRDCV